MRNTRFRQRLNQAQSPESFGAAALLSARKNRVRPRSYVFIVHCFSTVILQAARASCNPITRQSLW